VRTRRRPGQRGFSLLETLAALTVFSLITVGITPLLVSSLRGSALSRQQNFAKNLVQQAMERVRGLPYYDSSAGRDVLDLYYPNMSTGYSAGTFTTRCTATSQTPAPSAAKACPPARLDGASRLPAGYEMTFAAEFVAPVLAGTETFAKVEPAAGTYDSAALAKSTPPSQILRMTITASWTQIGTPRSFQLSSLVGNRKLTTDKVRGTGNVDFTLQAITGFRVELPTRFSGLTAEAGRSVSQIEIRAFPAASTENTVARITLQRQEYDDLLGTEVSGETLDPPAAMGASATVRAPATISSTTALGSTADATVTHPDLVPAQNVARVVADSTVNAASPVPLAAISAGLPSAAGNFSFAVGDQPEHLWMNNQADTSNTAKLKLDPLSHVLSLFRLGGNDIMKGSSSAAVTDIAAANRKVETTAVTRLPRLGLLASTVTIGNTSTDCSGCRGVVVIQDFDAQVNCKATGDPATSTATASWDAVLFYWHDPVGIQAGRYVPVVLSGSTTPPDNIDPLAAIRTANPLVIEGAIAADDVYLFEDVGKTGFLKEWQSTRTISRTITAAGGGSEARIDLPFAINIVTAKTNELNEETRLTINVGKLNCQAVDQR